MPFDANKLYCSEVLAILLQDNDGELPPIEPGLGCILTAGELGLRHRLDSPLALCAAFVLCQAVLILLADGSVVTVLKSDSWLHFFFFFVYFPLLENRELLGELDGIDVLLQQLSVSNLSASREPGRAMACCEWVELGTWEGTAMWRTRAGWRSHWWHKVCLL